MSTSASLLCIVVGMILTVVLLGRLSRPGEKKDAQALANKVVKRSNKTRKIWGVYFVIALILTFWSGYAALFFLAVVWIMQQNPNLDSSLTVSDTEKRTARRVYTWLFFSSMITVPIFLAMLFLLYSRHTSNNQHVVAAFVPVFLHLPLLLGLTSKSRFVYRHTQQGILLVALRAGMAALAISIGDYPEDGLWLFLLGNGSLWLFGSIWGWTQINRGDYSWMRQKGETVRAEQGSIPPPEMAQHAKLSPEKYIEYSKWYLRNKRQDTAKAYALEAFRLGDLEIRRQAVRVLDDLNEVEFF